MARWLHTISFSSKNVGVSMESNELFAVQMWNDDLTPMQFVVDILQDIFGKSKDEATQAMLNTHRQGRFTIAVLPKEEAEEALKEVSARANAAGHPLKCVLVQAPLLAT
jgi:ATP-dependent Clp protease adaptor protein ClpS